LLYSVAQSGLVCSAVLNELIYSEAQGGLAKKISQSGLV
jgi:hypothetical protein